tara:strand:- start:1423 stop:1674 length:252 start_codon:yes stop_codon:yes gene_type:complete
MVKNICIFVIFNFLGCAEAPPFERFSHEENKGEKEFILDFKKCKKNNNKYSYKIQGRELGFEGENTGYLGCMKLEGWSKKIPK